MREEKGKEAPRWAGGKDVILGVCWGESAGCVMDWLKCVLTVCVRYG